MRLFHFCFFVPFFISCQQKKSDFDFRSFEKTNLPNPSFTLQQIRVPKKQPVFSQSSRVSCFFKKEDLSSVIVSFKEGQRSFSTLLSSSEGLSNEAIEQIDTGFHIRAVYSNCTKEKNDLFLCAKSTTEIVSPGTHVKICKNQAYEAGSLENSALKALTAISATYDAAVKVKPELKNQIKKLRIMIEPRVEIIVEHNGEIYQGFETDNAFWRFDPKFFSPYAIYFLPHSQGYARFFEEAKYFEQPAVISHEYAHHLFWFIGANYRSNFLLKDKNISQNIIDHDAFASLDRLGDQKKQTSLEQENRNLSHQFVVSAINEMFADYVGYHSMKIIDADYRIKIESDEKSRDLTSETNMDGEVKSFSFSFLKHFLSPIKSMPKSYLTPDHQDIHTFGSIGAYALNEIFFESKEEKNSSLLSIKKMFEFIEKSADLARILGVYEKLIYFVEDFFERAILMEKSKRDFSLKDCKAIEKRFPVFYPIWLLKGNFSCNL